MPPKLEVPWSASLPYAMTQRPPLTTSEFTKEADKRHIGCSEVELREMWRDGLLTPFLEVRTRRFGSGLVGKPDDLVWVDSNRNYLTEARDSGRLADARVSGFRHQIRWAKTRSTWNGLLYSPWELIRLGALESKSTNRVPLVIGPNWQDLVDILTAIEFRYYPELHVTYRKFHGRTSELWEPYRKSFDAAEILQYSKMSMSQVLSSSFGLLRYAKEIAPWTDRWDDLVRYAPQTARYKLRGEALRWLDVMEAAEMLAKFYEDLTGIKLNNDSKARALDGHGKYVADNRLTTTGEPLDRRLSSLGLSPTPGCILVLEGEVEERLYPLVRDELGLSDDFSIVQVLGMRGINANLLLVASLGVTPRVHRSTNKAHELYSPPTKMLIAVDPESKYETEDDRNSQLQCLRNKILEGLESQGVVDVDKNELDPLLEVRTWSEPCFEFEHFSDLEIAAALGAVHHDCGGFDADKLLRVVRGHRESGRDVKYTWKNWKPDVSKTALADELWPHLQQRLRSEDEELPMFAQVIADAYKDAARFVGTWSLSRSVGER